MEININSFKTFIVGDIRNDKCFSIEELEQQLKEIENIMIKYGISKIDIAINPYLFPKDLTYNEQENNGN
jgi:hypothetical protein